MGSQRAWLLGSLCLLAAGCASSEPAPMVARGPYGPPQGGPYRGGPYPQQPPPGYVQPASYPQQGPQGPYNAYPQRPAPAGYQGPYNAYPQQPAPAFAPPPVPAPAAIETVTVDVLDATVAPGKSNGDKWDGLPGGKVPPETKQAMMVALGASAPQAAAAVVLAGLANKGFDPPDVYGTATLMMGGATSSLALGLVPDSYTPGWRPGAHFAHVTLDDRTRLRITLTDKDVANDDPMGSAELNPADLREALRQGRVTQVRVDGQTQGQILFVGISVIRE